MFRFLVFERREFVDAGIVDEYVDPVNRLLRFGRQMSDVRLLRDIRLYRDGRSALARNGGDDSFGVTNLADEIACSRKAHELAE